MPVQSPDIGNEAGGSSGELPTSSSPFHSKIPIINNYSRNFFVYLALCSAIILLVVIFFLFRDKVQLSFVGSGDDAVITVIGGKSITEGDLKAYDLIYNAEAKYQQSATESAGLASRDEVLNSLIRATKIEILAQREGIKVTDQEIEAEIEKAGGRDALEANISRYGWSFEDWNAAREIIILEQKLNDKVLAWRLGEFVSVRWDVLSQKVEDSEIGVFQEKSKTALGKIDDRFEAGEDVSELALFLRAEPSVSVDFSPNAIQINKLDEDPRIQFLQRVIKPADNQEWQGHILSLEPKVQSDLWCSKFACYLTRVLDGNDSKYTNLNDYLNATIK